MAKVKILKGKKFGYWKVLNFSHICEYGDAKWTCRCEICGRMYAVRLDSLQSGRSTKCKKCCKRGQ